MTLPIPDPGPAPPENATPKERETWRRANEKFLTENFASGAASVPATVDATDKRLQSMRRDHTRFLDAHSPMKASIWLALLRGTKDIIHDAEMLRRYRVAQAGGNAGEYTLPQTPAIIELGQQLVASALAGDTAAMERIAERIEGRAGLRAGDEDPDDPAKRRQADELSERIIRRLTEARLVPPSKLEPKIIDVEAVPVLDTSNDKA